MMPLVDKLSVWTIYRDLAVAGITAAEKLRKARVPVHLNYGRPADVNELQARLKGPCRPYCVFLDVEQDFLVV
jgi:hypothetical protein